MWACLCGLERWQGFQKAQLNIWLRNKRLNFFLFYQESFETLTSWLLFHSKFARIKVIVPKINCTKKSTNFTMNCWVSPAFALPTFSLRNFESHPNILKQNVMRNMNSKSLFYLSSQISGIWAIKWSAVKVVIQQMFVIYKLQNMLRSYLDYIKLTIYYYCVK